MSNSLILFDWEEIRGAQIQAVVGHAPTMRANGSVQCDAVGFLVGQIVVIVTVNTESDEIVVFREACSAISAWVPITELSFTIGEGLGSYWVGTNSAGCRNMFAIALGEPTSGLLPNRSLGAVEPALSCLQLGRNEAKLMIGRLDRARTAMVA